MFNAKFMIVKWHEKYVDMRDNISYPLLFCIEINLHLLKIRMTSCEIFA